MRILPAVVSLALLLSPVSLTFADSKVPEPIPPSELAFDWPVPCRVQIEQKTVKKGRSATLGYVLDVSAIKDDQIEVRFDRFKFLAMEGVDLENPLVKQQLAPVLAMTKLTPSFHVDKEGNLRQIVGLEQMRDRLIEEEKDEAIKAQMRQFLTNPNVAANLEAAVADYWNSWVGTWIGLELSQGEQIEGTLDIPVFGSNAEQKVTIRRLTDPASYPGHIRIQYEGRVEGEDFKKAMTDFLRQTAIESGRPAEEVPEEMFETCKKISKLEVITDPKNLRPKKVISISETTIKSVEGQTQSDVEKKEYIFGWPAPEKATPTTTKPRD